ncbi:MAG: GTP diphosphokinase [Gammaproteobacteria bacterium]|nr:GTP diphosphokinase [Gammaproteobacteria bacterium]
MDPLLEHARGVVEILAALHLGAEPLVAAYFCSIPQTMISDRQLTAAFGADVAELVNGVHQLRIVDDAKPRSRDREEEKQHLEGLRKMLLGMAQDVRVVLIKLAERVQIMRELKTMPEEARRRVARETLDIFAPLANRLGIWQLKWELEDLSFRFLEPEDYQRIAQLLDGRRVDRERFIDRVKHELREALIAAGIKAEVAGRPKHIYSIWRKMVGKDVDFHELFDVRAVRVLVDDVAACYAALGIVHSYWQPIRSEFDDYIASPKENQYQSLHTAVVGPEGKTLEVQIRTLDMHQHSEFGVAAHWGYKEGGRHDDEYREKIAWLRQILEWKDEERDSADFIDRFKSEVFHDRVYVLTPEGKVMDLPRGATPLDFAYHIHTELGHRYRGAKVDGKMVPIHYALKNGEQVEIFSARQGTPSRDWLNAHLGYLKSSRARSKVRVWFRQQDFHSNVGHGRQLLDRELRRLGVSGVKLEALAKRFRFESADDFYAALGCGDISGTQVAGALREQVLPAHAEVPPRRRSKRRGRTGKKSADNGVHIMGVGGLTTHLAQCCKPVPDDRIAGFITRGRGVSIHRRDCRNLMRLEMTEGERLVEVGWSEGSEQAYPVDIDIQAYDRQGLLRDITDVLSDGGLNVVAVNTHTDRETHVATMTLTLDVTDVSQLSQALGKIEQLSNVLEASRKRVD